MIELFTFDQLQHPEWLWLAFYPVLHRLLVYLISPSVTYAEQSLLPWVLSNLKTGKSFYRSLFYFVAWIFFAITIAGPRTQEAIFPAEEPQSTPEILLLIDVSRSMSAEDVKPSRIERARYEIMDLITRSQQIKIGLAVFSARTNLLAPPTLDKSTLLHYVNLLHHGLLPTEGSNLIQALSKAPSYFSKATHAKSIILISDGDYGHDHDDFESMLATTLTDLIKLNIPVHSLGIATESGFELINHDGSWLTDDNKPVISRLNDKLLNHISQTTFAQYSPYRDSDSDWETIFDSRLSQYYTGSIQSFSDNTTTSGISRINNQPSLNKNTWHTQWKEKFSPYLVLSLLFFYIALWKDNSKRIIQSKLSTIFIMIIFTNMIADDAYADNTNISTAYQAFQNEQYEKAYQLYNSDSGYLAKMGAGISAYQIEQYSKAARAFTHAILLAEDAHHRGLAIFNLANTRYKTRHYDEADSLYRDVLRYIPDHKGSITNIKHTSSLLEKRKLLEKIKTDNEQRQERSITGDAAMEDNAINHNLIDAELYPDFEHKELNSNNNLVNKIDNTKISIARHSEVSKNSRDKDWAYSQLTFQDIERLVLKHETNEAVIWKRIYEQDENIVAPLEYPLDVKNVKPW